MIKIIFLGLLLWLSGCDYRSETIAGDFQLTWIDVKNNQSLCRVINDAGDCYDVVGPYVFAIAHNETFIFAKQHPFKQGTSTADTSITHYYIVNYRQFDLDTPLPTALTKQAFEEQTKTLGKIDWIEK